MIAEVFMTVGDIAARCGGTVTAGDPGTEVTSITSDSRETREGSLFVPLVGERFDGHDFIPELAEKRKVTAFLSMHGEHTALAHRFGLASIQCADTLKALGAVAGAYRSGLDLSVIGVTGTNGKTTTKEIIAALLAEKGPVLKSEKNYNNEIGVPFTLFGARREHRIAVIEMGMNHSGELDRLTRIAKPDLAVITNVGQGHLEFLGDVENVALAKSEIMHGMAAGSTVIINRETECFEILKNKALHLGLILKTFGLEEDAEYRPDRFHLRPDGIDFTYRGIAMSAPLYGVHNLYNLMAAMAVADYFGVAPAQAATVLAGIAGVEGRSQVLAARGFIVINDTYNANPLSLRYALESARLIYPGSRKIALLSDMKELGESSRNYHRESGKLVAEAGFDYCGAWGEMAEAYAEGARSGGMPAEKVAVFGDKGEMSRTLAGLIREGDVVLVKGSRSMKMEEVVTYLTRSE